MCHSQNLRRPLSVPCPTQCVPKIINKIKKYNFIINSPPLALFAPVPVISLLINNLIAIQH